MTTAIRSATVHVSAPVRKTRLKAVATATARAIGWLFTPSGVDDVRMIRESSTSHMTYAGADRALRIL